VILINFVERCVTFNQNAHKGSWNEPQTRMFFHGGMQMAKKKVAKKKTTKKKAAKKKK